MIYFTGVITGRLGRGLAHEMLPKCWWAVSAQERLSVVWDIPMSKKQAGFSLIELLIVLAITSTPFWRAVRKVAMSLRGSGMGLRLRLAILLTATQLRAVRVADGVFSVPLVHMAKSSRGGAPFREVVLAPIRLHLCIQTR